MYQVMRVSACAFVCLCVCVYVPMPVVHVRLVRQCSRLNKYRFKQKGGGREGKILTTILAQVNYRC